MLHDFILQPVPSSPRRPGPKTLSLSSNTSSSSLSSNNGGKSSNSTNKAPASTGKQSSSTSRTPTQTMGGKDLSSIKPLPLTTAITSNKVQSLSAYATAAGGQTPSSTTSVGSSISTTSVTVLLSCTCTQYCHTHLTHSNNLIQRRYTCTCVHVCTLCKSPSGAHCKRSRIVQLPHLWLIIVCLCYIYNHF